MSTKSSLVQREDVCDITEGFLVPLNNFFKIRNAVSNLSRLEPRSVIDAYGDRVVLQIVKQKVVYHDCVSCGIVVHRVSS